MQALTVRLSACFAFALMGCAADASEPSESLHASTQALTHKSPIPASLAVPKGTHPAFILEGVGTQNYACKAAAEATYAWTLVEPEATLYGPFHWVAGHHYLGPTWEGIDGSSVVGAKLAGETVDATAIPWLLLQAKSHAGKGWFSSITYVQRLHTVGGLAPSTGCDAAHADATADVDYRATYVFYR
jgi:Protein of unknown function (DUF3455)